ncbi:T9SS type A sorting domain-containing protein [Flavobacterium wongokense]|uniref:T9SS type A sorting domain-containing protein n=1 Tax=Flavobacterium wongokense TaxID=2910674 RepID=UPI001F3CAEFE|nr:T9SS type A sorting domain-containing protein [Flavobacterium sp. WG47]MCF6131944.1 T9SS type A sorting domain-containing protein [Flavobacterium sp. WG47]
MKTKLLLFFSIGFITLANAQCGNVPPPPGISPVFAVDMDNDGYTTFDFAYWVEHIERPRQESIYGVSSSGYDFEVKGGPNLTPLPLQYTNTVLGEECVIFFNYNGNGPQFVAQPPCFWGPTLFMGLILVAVPYNQDFDNDGILNVDEDTNGNRNLMDDDDDHDGIINYKDASNNLGLQENTNIALSVYPNPVTNGVVSFESNTAIKTVSIYDLSGKQLSETKIDTNTIRVDNLAVGIYFLKFQSENGFVYKKIAVN